MPPWLRPCTHVAYDVSCIFTCSHYTHPWQAHKVTRLPDHLLRVSKRLGSLGTRLMQGNEECIQSHAQIDHGSYLILFVLPGSGVNFDAMANACLLDTSLNRHAFIEQQGIGYTIVPTPVEAIIVRVQHITPHESTMGGFKVGRVISYSIPYVRHASIFHNQPPVMTEYALSTCMYVQ